MGTYRSQYDKDEIDRLAFELASARNCRGAWQDLANTLRGELNEAKAEIERIKAEAERLKESRSLEICATESDEHYHDLRAELDVSKAEIDRLALELASARNCRSAWQDLANTLRGELNELKAEAAAWAKFRAAMKELP